MLIDKKILPRNLIPIKNKFNISSEKFSCYVYFISQNSIRILVKNLQECSGWMEDIFLYIDEVEINIGNSDTYIKDIIIENNNLNLEPDLIIYKEQLIPKRIIQTSFNNDVNFDIYNSINSFIDLNPEYEYIFFDNIDCRDFIKNNFDIDILNGYDLLVPGAYQADLFRYCALYILGGYYFDCKLNLKTPFRHITGPEDTEILVNDHRKGFKFNGIMITIPGNKFILDCINKCLYNIHNNVYTDWSAGPMGPGVLTECAKDINARFFNNFHGHGNKESNFKGLDKDVILCSHASDGYYKNYSKNYGKLYYDDLWKLKQIYYKLLYENENYKILLYPSIDFKKIKFNIINEEFIIKVKNNKVGKINIINKLTHCNKIIELSNKYTIDIDF